jgi:hypothetical protein
VKHTPAKVVLTFDEPALALRTALIVTDPSRRTPHHRPAHLHLRRPRHNTGTGGATLAPTPTAPAPAATSGSGARLWVGLLAALAAVGVVLVLLRRSTYRRDP